MHQEIPLNSKQLTDNKGYEKRNFLRHVAWEQQNPCQKIQKYYIQTEVTH